MQVAVSHNEGLFTEDMDRKRAPFETFIAEPVHVGRGDNLCKRDASGNYASMLLDDEWDDDSMHAIEAAVVHAGGPLDWSVFNVEDSIFKDHAA